MGESLKLMLGIIMISTANTIAEAHRDVIAKWVSR
jgi:hypothetical protein